MFVFSVAFPVVAAAEKTPGECCTDDQERDGDPEWYVSHEVVDVSDFIEVGVHGVDGGVVGQFCCLTDRVVYFQVLGDDLGAHRGGIIQVEELGEVRGEH